MKLIESLKSHTDELVSAAQGFPFKVFLCGPNLSDGKPSAKLRARLKKKLEKEGFEVVLGEDEGLDNAELKAIGINAQDNELEFIRKYCNAVVIVADSVGAFCELGLFSWHFVHKDGVFKDGQDTDCIVLIGKRFQRKISYLMAGPAAAVEGFGKVEFVSFAKYSGADLVRRLKQRRGVITLDNKRGRPRKRVP